MYKIIEVGPNAGSRRPRWNQEFLAELHDGLLTLEPGQRIEIPWDEVERMFVESKIDGKFDPIKTLILDLRIKCYDEPFKIITRKAQDGLRLGTKQIEDYPKNDF